MIYCFFEGIWGKILVQLKIEEFTGVFYVNSDWRHCSGIRVYRVCFVVVCRAKTIIISNQFILFLYFTKKMTSPAEDDLKSALVAIKSQNPSLGIAKTHALLLANHPNWVVSEKRTRKLLQHEGLVLNGATPPPARAPDSPVYPSSRVIHNLDLHRWTPKVKVKYFDKKKGKGLVAAQEIKEGEVIWKEDPFILAPEWYTPHPISFFSSHPSILVLINTTSQGYL